MISSQLRFIQTAIRSSLVNGIPRWSHHHLYWVWDSTDIGNRQLLRVTWYNYNAFCPTLQWSGVFFHWFASTSSPFKLYCPISTTSAFRGSGISRGTLVFVFLLLREGRYRTSRLTSIASTTALACKWIWIGSLPANSLLQNKQSCFDQGYHLGPLLFFFFIFFEVLRSFCQLVPLHLWTKKWDIILVLATTGLHIMRF